MITVDTIEQKFRPLFTDSNLPDVLEMADLIRDECGGGNFVYGRGARLSISTGVDMVEAVDELLVCGSELRLLTPVEIHRRLVALDQSRRLVDLAAALYTWYGCIAMAKMTREVHNAPEGARPYTDEVRWRGYKRLVQQNVKYQSQGNYWVMYGIQLAKHLSASRGNVAITDWIPPDATYWG